MLLQLSCVSAIGRMAIVILLCAVVAGSQQAPSSSVAHGQAPLVPFKLDGKWGYEDARGHIVIAPQFDQARKFSDGLAAVYVQTSPPQEYGCVDWRGVRRTCVRETKRWGFINTAGAVVIAPDFEAVGDFSEGLAAASRQLPDGEGGTWGYIDTKGKMVIRPQFSEAHRFSDGLALVHAGGVAATDPIVKSWVKMGYIDKSGRWVFGSRFWYYFFDNFSEGAVPFRLNIGKWGYMDEKGKIFIRPRFEWAGDFSDGLASVLVKGSCAEIDKSGRVVSRSSEPHLGPHQRKSPVQTRGGTYYWKPDKAPCP